MASRRVEGRLAGLGGDEIQHSAFACRIEMRNPASSSAQRLARNAIAVAIQSGNKPARRQVTPGFLTRHHLAAGNCSTRFEEEVG
jgi:hypothetical protein